MAVIRVNPSGWHQETDAGVQRASPVGWTQESAGGATGVDVSVPSASIAVSATAPSVAVGAALLVGSLAIAVAATAPSIATGAAVSVPSTEVTVSASAPTVAATAPVLPVLSAATLIFVSGTSWKPQVTATYSWTPAALFASSEEGGWYEPGPTTCYTDDGTTAAGENDLVYRMDDLSGNGNHLYQTDEAKRPILRKSGELWYLEFDGVDDLLIMPIGTLTLGAGWTLAAAGAVTETGTGGSLGSTSPGFGMAVDGLNYQRISLETDSTPRAATHSRGSGASPDAVAFAEDAFGGFSRNTNITVAARFSASDIEAALSSTTLSGVTPADTWGANTSSGARISFANRGNGTGIGKTIWFGAVAVNEELSNESAASLIEYLATLGGVTLA